MSRGDTAGAIATEEKAIKQLEAQTEDKSQSGPLHKVYLERLELFRKVAEEKS